MTCCTHLSAVPFMLLILNMAEVYDSVYQVFKSVGNGNTSDRIDFASNGLLQRLTGGLDR